MTYVKTTPPGLHTTDAEFRTWATALHDALIAVGLVQTTDTGQLDIATATKPASGYAGFRVYRFSDTLQATSPVFIKIEYGTGNPVSCPGLRVQVGTATNGAGTMGGRFTTAAALTPSSAANPVDQYVATGLDKSYLALFWYVSQSTANWGGSLVIDRSRNADGTPNGDGLYVLTNAGTAATFHTCTMICYTGSTNLGTGIMCIVPSSATSGVQGLEVSLIPHFCYTPKLQSPVKSILSVWAADLPYASQVSVNHYGVAPYVSLGNRNGYGATHGGASLSAVTLAFRAE